MEWVLKQENWDRVYFISYMATINVWDRRFFPSESFIDDMEREKTLMSERIRKFLLGKKEMLDTHGLPALTDLRIQMQNLRVKEKDRDAFYYRNEEQKRGLPINHSFSPVTFEHEDLRDWKTLVTYQNLLFHEESEFRLKLRVLSVLLSCIDDELDYKSEIQTSFFEARVYSNVEYGIRLIKLLNEVSRSRHVFVRYCEWVLRKELEPVMTKTFDYVENQMSENGIKSKFGADYDSFKTFRQKGGKKYLSVAKISGTGPPEGDLPSISELKL